MMHKRYLRWLLFFCCITLVPAVALNLLVLKHEGDLESMSFAASDWQRATGGITFTPKLGGSWLFKTLRLNDQLAELDTVIFGSSTGMPIDRSMMPPRWRMYNFTQTGSPFSASIAQAEYLVQHAPQIKHYIVALDWSLDWLLDGTIYHARTIAPVDLSRPQRGKRIEDRNPPSLVAMLRESVSYPRMEQLWEILGRVAKSPNPKKSFREHFLQLASDEYVCPNGIDKGKDFGVHNRGLCDGFRNDGSATFWGYGRIDDSNRLLLGALAHGSRYAKALERTQGAIDASQFSRLAALDRLIKRQGGQLILYIPPLMPGFDAGFARHPRFSSYLERTKRELAAWATANDAIVVDFGPSEKFGCISGEFLDEHHADGNCYRKIFSDFWQNGGIQKKLADSARANSGK